MSKRVKFDEDTAVYTYAIRGAMCTASTTISDGVLSDKERLNRDTQVVVGDADNYQDIIYVYGVNSSDQAVRVNFHENFGGTSQFKLQMAASSSEDISFMCPWKATEKGSGWWVDYDTYGGVTDPDDVTNTVVNVFIQYMKHK